MASEKPTKLETFIERHRPDFDADEPGPDLWARLEQQLGQPGPGVGPVLLVEKGEQEEAAAGRAPTLAPRPATPAPAPAAAASPAPPTWARYGVAAALAALLMALVFSQAPRPVPVAGPAVASAAAEAAEAASAADAARFGPTPAALAAEGLGGTPADPRLSAAVRGMEAYYAGQLSARQAELRRLDGQRPAADWPRELASLDSSYQQLKEELPQHPQPEVVLTAMNRNLQIRLDILDQQLAYRTAGPDPATQASGTMVSLADSRARP